MYPTAKETLVLASDDVTAASRVAAQITRYSTDTWGSIKSMIDQNTGLPQDRITLQAEEKPRTNTVTSPTNIGLFLASLVAARDLKLIGETEMKKNASQVLDLLTNLERYKGLYYNWYNTQDGTLTAHNPFISTVDNAWLLTGLLTLKNACHDFEEKVEAIIAPIEFSCLYDSTEHLFYGGVNPVKKSNTPWHYGLLNTEARIASYIGLHRYSLPVTHPERLLRDSILHDPLHKSWGGSMFEVLMPSLFISEDKSEDWSRVYKHHFNGQVAAGADNQGFWGFSPCDNPDGVYTEFGVKELAVKPGGYGSDSVVTPHAIFLTLPREPMHAIQTLSRLEETYPHSYTEGLGFSDSIDVKTGKASPSRLILDQTMSFLALYNYQTDNRLHSYFNNEALPLRVSLPIS